MPMSSGGVLRYSILIEAIDRATGRLNSVMNTAKAAQRVLAFPDTGMSNALKGQISLYSKLTQVTEQYSDTVYNKLKNSKYGFMADIYKAQQQDASGTVDRMKTQFKSLAGMFEGVSIKNLRAFNPDMQILKDVSRRAVDHLFPTDDLKAERKVAEQELRGFWKNMYKSPYAEHGQYGNIFDKMFKSSQKLSQPTQMALQSAFQNYFGTSMEAVGKMSATDQAIIKHRDAFTGLQQEISKTSEQYQKLNQNFESAKQQIKGMSILYAQMGQTMTRAMAVTKPLAEAMAFSSGGQMARTPFGHTNMGATTADMGQFYRAAARSPYEKEMIANQGLIMNYSKMFNQQTSQFVPVLSGMETIFGEGMSMQQKMMMLTGASMKSNLDFSGWFTLYMQGAIPQMESLQNNLNETLSVIGALSNQGLGAFAGFGISSAIQGMIKPSKKSQELQAQYGMDLGKIIRTEGIIDAFEQIDEALNKLTNKQRLEVMAQLFPGMGTGVVEVLMKSTKNARMLNREMSSMLEVNRASVEVSTNGYNQLMKLSAVWSNALTGLLYNVADTSAFRGITKMMTDPAQEITRAQDKALGKRSLMSEIMSGLLGVGGIGVATFGAVNALGFRSQMAKTSQKMNEYAMLSHYVNTQGMPYGDAERELNRVGRPRTAFMGTKFGSGVVAGLQTVSILAGIYAITRSISNATKDYYARENKEQFVDPITKLSIADFRGAMKDDAILKDVKDAIQDAKNALERNTRSNDRNTKGKRIAADPRYSMDLLKSVAGGA